MPPLPQRKTTRLRGFDYRLPGPYALTICTQGRRWRFGFVSEEGQLVQNAVGTMVIEIWNDIPRQFPGTELDAVIVMPNHLHGIVTLGTEDTETNPDVADVIGWFKAVTTNRYIIGVRERGWPRFDRSLWQRDYYEHIVRNDVDMDRFRSYIEQNPAKWATDRYHEPE